MALINFLVIILTTITACTMAAPRLPSSVQPVKTCNINTVSVNLRAGGFHFNGTHNLGTCHTLTIPNMPTTTRLKHENVDDQACDYNIRIFSDHDCSEELSTFRLEVNQDVVLNKRKPICSYKLNNTNSLPVRAEFTGSSNHSNAINGSHCFNLENNYCENINDHPHSVAVYDSTTGRIIENNFLELYTQPGCNEYDKLKDRNGAAVEVKNVINLPELTRVNPQQNVQSFMIRRA